jgi:hypothetical protein
MAGDWIKMRAALFQNPKLIVVARRLSACREFGDWLTPGGGSEMNGQIVSEDALRCVTCALLLKVWSASREFGSFVDDDLLLLHISLDDIDQIAGVRGVGAAMEAVGWAKKWPAGDGVILPNFKQHNVPMTPAEKQSAYRSRRSNPLLTKGNASVTKKSPEKRRVEKRISITASAVIPLPPNLDTEEFRPLWEDWKRHRSEIHKPLTASSTKLQLAKLDGWGQSRAIAALKHSIANGWQGIFEPEEKRNGRAATTDRDGPGQSYRGPPIDAPSRHPR